MLKKSILVSACLAAFAFAGTSQAATLKISGESASAGLLGYFVVDDSTLTSWVGVYASDFITYSFYDAVSGLTYDPTTVDGDTGVTYSDLVAGVWTVVGGGGDSLTDADTSTGVWIAGTDYLLFTPYTSYDDVTWTTTDYVMSAVPLPATGLLLGLGFGVLGFAGKRRRRSAVA